MARRLGWGGCIGLAALALAAGTGSAGAVAGAAVGLLIGLVYAATLRYGFRQVPRLGPEAGLRMIQVGSVARLAFVFVAFLLASRLLPWADLTWGAATAALPLLGSIVRVARQGVRA
jgi:hypothetical protein